MPFIVILKADGRFYMMGDAQGNVIGFQTMAQAFEYFDAGKGESIPMNGCVELKVADIAPSIISIPTFREVVESILPERVKVYRLVNGSIASIGLGTRSGVGAYWERGRHKAFVWLRKGEGSANTKLRGKEDQVTQMIKDGLTDVQIARLLKVHYQTVTHFIQQMKLGQGIVRRLPRGYRSNTKALKGAKLGPVEIVRRSAGGSTSATGLRRAG